MWDGGVCLDGRIEIAVIVGVILLGVGWKAVGGGCIYQSRPIQQQQEGDLGRQLIDGWMEKDQPALPVLYMYMDMYV